MVSQTNEQALEAAIEKHLTGTCLEDLKAGVQEAAPDYNKAMYQLGYPSDFDMHYAIDTKFFWKFLQNTQEQELEKLKKNSPKDWERKVLERFDKLIKKHGILHLLGFDHELGQAEQDEMEGFEIEILEKLGIVNPYIAK